MRGWRTISLMTDAAFPPLKYEGMSVEEYLRTEESSPVKREYVHGFVYPLAQAGTSDAHALITGNIFAALRPHARKRGALLTPLICGSQRLTAIPTITPMSW